MTEEEKNLDVRTPAEEDAEGVREAVEGAIEQTPVPDDLKDLLEPFGVKAKTMEEIFRGDSFELSLLEVVERQTELEPSSLQAFLTGAARYHPELVGDILEAKGFPQDEESEAEDILITEVTVTKEDTPPAGPETVTKEREILRSNKSQLPPVVQEVVGKKYDSFFEALDNSEAALKRFFAHLDEIREVVSPELFSEMLIIVAETDGNFDKLLKEELETHTWSQVVGSHELFKYFMQAMGGYWLASKRGLNPLVFQELLIRGLKDNEKSAKWFLDKWAHDQNEAPSLRHPYYLEALAAEQLKPEDEDQEPDPTFYVSQPTFNKAFFEKLIQTAKEATGQAAS